jgi:hypothetical protein
MGQLKEIYCYLVNDTDGVEGIPATYHNGIMTPLVGDQERIQSFKVLAQSIANTGKQVRLCRFASREEIEVLEAKPPEGGYDAELRDAHENNGILYGYVYNDKRQRFPDGTEIQTKPIRERLADSIFRTENATYKVTFGRRA